MRTLLEERSSRTDGTGEDLRKMITFADSQTREAEALASRLDRYAAGHSVPMEWRR